jgi:serine/threonine-protein kinase
MEDLSGRTFGAYTIVAPLGEGGMASVYKAHQPSVNRDVAIKILGRHFMQDPEFLTRFRHEAYLVAQFQHPHILPVFDFGESGGYSYLVMPLIKGGQLSDLMDGTPMRLERVDRIMRQICDALDYAHSKGVVHRDIKPTNILVDERLNCLVADFGIARMTEGTTKLTATGTVVGTPTYMSPEQAAGETVGPQSDLYSLGIMLYEMVAGQVPFKGDTPFAIALKHLTAAMPPPATFNPRLGPAIENVVLKAVARQAKDRFASGEELANALSEAIRQTQEIQAKSTIVAAPVSELAPTMAVMPRTVPMSPRAPTVPAPAVRKSEPLKSEPRVPEATAKAEPASRKIWPWIAAALPIAAVVGYFAFGGSLQSPPSQPPSTPVPAPVVAKPAPPIPPHSPKPVAEQPPKPTETKPVETPTPPDATPAEPPPSVAAESPTGRGNASPQFLMRGCNEGRAQACMNLARMFETGRGVPQDDARAVGLMTKACDLGDARACNWLKNRFGRRGR